MKRKAYIILVILFILVISATVTNADIIKMKRGVSFEGRVLSETEDEYEVELNVGIVHFKKEDVEEIEFFADIENAQMVQEWYDEKFADEKDEGTQIKDSEKIESRVAEITSEENVSDKELIQYRGRLVTPEVYSIIQKEKEIQARRYKFIQEQQKKKENAFRSPIPDKEVIKPSVIQKREENRESLRERTFGSETKEYGSGIKKLEYKEFGGQKYGSAQTNTI